MHIFYTGTIDGNTAILSPEESQHCIRVLRMSAGDQVSLIDGKGGLFTALITLDDPKQCILEIQTRMVRPVRSYNLHIAIAPTKNTDRFEWFIEKTVEMGIDTITPLLCTRSERRILKTDRLQKLILSAMKQAMVAKFPILNELIPFEQFIRNLQGFSSNRYVAHCEEHEKITLNTLIKNTDVVVLIGPEGDFTPEEIELALSHKFKAISLGSNRLRTETAGIYACNAIHVINND